MMAKTLKIKFRDGSCLDWFGRGILLSYRPQRGMTFAGHHDSGK